MATGNFILKGSRRKVGNIVTYSRDGKQVVRSLAASVKNPKTSSQSLQRSSFAPAAKFYSPLSVVLEQSFEGKNKSKSYSEFLKKAINDGRANGWNLPKSIGFFPLPYMVSKGTIQPVSYVVDVEDHFLTVNIPGGDYTTIGQLSQAFINAGYKEGDQVTFILIATNTDAVLNFGASYWPIASRFIIAPDSTVTIVNAFDSFTIDNLSANQIGVTSDKFKICAGAVIVSRYENGVWRRSTQTLAVDSTLMDFVLNADNRTTAVQSFMKSAGSLVTSDVYLNNGTSQEEPTLAIFFQLSDGTAMIPKYLYDDEGIMRISGLSGTNPINDVAVKLGSDYLLTLSTKGAAPQGADVSLYVETRDPKVQEWLQSKGVAASVFAA